MDTEEGHLLPSFGLAQALKKRGHHIAYISVVDNEQLVLEQGFPFYPVLEDIYPLGFRKQLKELNGIVLNGHATHQMTNNKPQHASEIVNGVYDSFLKNANADLFVISTFLQTDILLLYYKYNIRPVVFTPFLREAGKTAASDCVEHIANLPVEKSSLLVEFIEEMGVQVTSVWEMARPLNTFCELVACPYELEILPPLPTSNVHHIGPSIRQTAGVLDVHALYQVPRNKKIIFASMGSQTIRHGNTCDTFFGKVINAMRHPGLQEMHLIVSTGKEYDPDRLQPVPGNVTVAGWVPQLNILKTASLAIIHGGLGSVKECIYYGVPMIVLPLGYDQPLNAKRVMHHKLGIAGDVATITETELQNYMLHLLNDETYQTAVKNMQGIFQQKEEDHSGVNIIEELLHDKTLH